MTRRLALPLAAALLVLAGPAAAYVLPTDALLDQLREQRKDVRPQPLRVEGTLTLLGPGGELVGAPAVHLVRTDGRCRLELAGELDGLAEGAAVVWARGRPLPAEPLAELGLMEALACPVLAAGDDLPGRVALLLRELRVDSGYTGLSRLEAQVAYVIGARAWETDRPQVWLHKDTLLPLRIIGRLGGRLADVSLTGQAGPDANAWHPARIELWVDGEPRLRFTAGKVVPGARMDASLFQ